MSKARTGESLSGLPRDRLQTFQALRANAAAMKAAFADLPVVSDVAQLMERLAREKIPSRQRRKPSGRSHRIGLI